MLPLGCEDRENVRYAELVALNYKCTKLLVSVSNFCARFTECFPPHFLTINSIEKKKQFKHDDDGNNLYVCFFGVDLNILLVYIW